MKFRLTLLFALIFSSLCSVKLHAEDFQAFIEQYNSIYYYSGSMTVSRTSEDGYDILYEGGVGGDGNITFDENTIYDIGSITKLFTTVSILQLRDAGLLSLDDTLPMYFDNVPEDKQEITIEQLLLHTSGLFVEENENVNVTKEEEIQRIMDSPLQFVPGEDFFYSNCGFTLLAAIIEDVSGMSYEQYVSQNIFVPFGLTSTGFVNSDYLDDSYISQGTMSGYEYTRVNELPYGWYSKGYTDILSRV